MAVVRAETYIVIVLLQTDHFHYHFGHLKGVAEVQEVRLRMRFQRYRELIFVITPSWLYSVDRDSTLLKLKQEALDDLAMDVVGH